jgi:xylulokinase
MIAVGGLAQGEAERRILADVYGMDVIRLRYLEEATSIGAAVIAGVGAGLLDGFGSVGAFNERQDRTRPNRENVKTYEKLKRVFEASYASQLEIFGALAEI